MMLKTKYVKNNLPALFLKLMREISVHSYGFLFSLTIPLAVGLRVAHRWCFGLVLVIQFCKWLFWRCLKC